MDYLLYDSETRYFGILVWVLNGQYCGLLYTKLHLRQTYFICNDCAFIFNFDYMVFDTAGHFWKRDIALY